RPGGGMPRLGWAARPVGRRPDSVGLRLRGRESDAAPLNPCTGIVAARTCPNVSQGRTTPHRAIVAAAPSAAVRPALAGGTTRPTPPWARGRPRILEVCGRRAGCTLERRTAALGGRPVLLIDGG